MFIKLNMLPRTMNMLCCQLIVLVLLAASRVYTKSVSPEIPCVEFSQNINVDCLCSLNEVNATRINCDNVVFSGDFPVMPYR